MRSTLHQGARCSVLFGSLVQETRELPDEFAYRFTGEYYELVATFITSERRCPFLCFKLDVAPHHGPIWLRSTGPHAGRSRLQSERREPLSVLPYVPSAQT